MLLYSPPYSQAILEISRACGTMNDVATCNSPSFPFHLLLHSDMGIIAIWHYNGILLPHTPPPPHLTPLKQTGNLRSWELLQSCSCLCTCMCACLSLVAPPWWHPIWAGCFLQQLNVVSYHFSSWFKASRGPYREGEKIGNANTSLAAG